MVSKLSQRTTKMISTAVQQCTKDCLKKNNSAAGASTKTDEDTHEPFFQIQMICEHMCFSTFSFVALSEKMPWETNRMTSQNLIQKRREIELFVEWPVCCSTQKM